ncbi:DUF4252 domain-containing protein [Flavobacterium sp. RNTU_13]|uniref:DUF4252 domain-containing protein n=1 Tax=Flavobacterium sp. RNTU_13 TaxID=3375145 RepID=UPI0039874786
MVRLFYILAAAAVALLTSCSGEPTMQTYFVDKSEQPGFSAIDLSPSLINTNKLNLKPEEKAAMASIKSVNILVYKADSANPKSYEQEAATVLKIIKTDHYDELMKFNFNGAGANLSTKGEGEHIDEFVVYAHKPDAGLALFRVTGNDMTPNNVMTIASVLQKASVNSDQFKPLQKMFLK